MASVPFISAELAVPGSNPASATPHWILGAAGGGGGVTNKCVKNYKLRTPIKDDIISFLGLRLKIVEAYIEEFLKDIGTHGIIYLQGHIPRLENCVASSQLKSSKHKRSSENNSSSSSSSVDSEEDAAPLLCSQLSLDCLNCTCDYDCQYGTIRSL